MSKQSRLHLSAIFAAAGLFAVAACSIDSAMPDKGVEVDAPGAGKADSFFNPTSHVVTLGTPIATAITDDERFHGFFFELGANATVTLETAASQGGEEVDTVVYLYQRGSNGWGRYIAKNDDISWSNWFSRLDDLALEAGEYRLIVKGYARRTRGPFQLLSSCEGAGCPSAALPIERCLFGASYGGFRDGPTFDTFRSDRLTAPDSLSATEQAQALRAIKEAYEEATTIEEGFAAIDASELYVTGRYLRADGAAYVAFEYGAGDNSYGAIFAQGDVVPAAVINDYDLYECTADAGPGAGPGADCAGDAACREGLRCFGIEDSLAVGKCVVSGPFAGEGDTCAVDGDCGEHLVCAGLNYVPDGFCVPYWMRGTFATDAGGDIPDGGAIEATITVYGLATVDVDVVPDIVIAHQDPAQLRVTLINPATAEVVLFDGETETAEPGLIVIQAPARGFSGDEEVNGRWTLRVEDRHSGVVGDLRHAELTITSRWD